MDVEIIEATEAHIDLLAPLFDAYRVFYEQPSDVDAARSFLLDRIQRDESVLFMAVGVDRGRRVPLGFAQLYPSFSSVSMKRLWILNDLYVAPEGRRAGIARLLIDRARELAIASHARAIVLETAIDNTGAQALYDAYGFAKDTEFLRYALTI